MSGVERDESQAKELDSIVIAVVMLVVVGTAVMAAAQSAEEGVANFYSDDFQGKKTASGEAYDKKGSPRPTRSSPTEPRSR